MWKGHGDMKIHPGEVSEKKSSPKISLIEEMDHAPWIYFPLLTLQAYYKL
jgi:hypothetical protein